MNKKQIRNLVSEVVEEVLQEKTSVTDRNAKLTKTNNSKRKLNEMARTSIKYTIGDKSKVDELSVAPKVRARINLILQYIEDNGPSTTISLLNITEPPIPRQQQLNPLILQLSSLGILQPEEGQEDLFAAKAAKLAQPGGYFTQKPVDDNPGSDEFYRDDNWGSDEPETELEPTDSDVEKVSDDGKPKATPEEGNALMDYLDLLEKMGRVEAAIRKLPKEPKIVVQAIMAGKEVSKGMIDSMNKKYASIDDSTSKIIDQIKNLYTLKNKYSVKMADLEERYPRLKSNHPDKLSEVLFNRFQKLANIPK